MAEQKKKYKTRISDAEDFGVFFNCLTRRYLWDFDPELLQLILRIMDRYLPYFSIRTLICSIRDLAEEKDGIWHGTRETIPEEQVEDYGRILKELVKRYLEIECSGITDDYRKEEEIRELARDGYFTECYRKKEHWGFPSADAFAEWVKANRLDEGDGAPLWEEKTLPITADFLPDFYQLCIANIQYSYGRHSYMPSLCQRFIQDHLHLLSDEAVERIIAEVDESLRTKPITDELGGREDREDWERFSAGLKGEMMSREWFRKADEIMQDGYKHFEAAIHEMAALRPDLTEEDCIDAWFRLDGIYRFLLDKHCPYDDKKEYKKLVRWAKRYVSKNAWKLWEKEHADEYVKTGPHTYVRKKGMEKRK